MSETIETIAEEMAVWMDRHGGGWRESPRDLLPDLLPFLRRAHDAEKITKGHITLRHLQVTNDARRDRWHVEAARSWSTLEWAGAMCGEAGEAANVAKKLLRIDLGTRGNEAAEHVITGRDALRVKLADEIGGTILYAALLASAEGIDLESAVARCFTSKSTAMGFPEIL